jgi:hypothetical protein
MIATLITWMFKPFAIGVIVPVTEGTFDFIVPDTAYSPPVGNAVNFTVDA